MDKRWLTLFTMLREFAIIFVGWVEDEILCTSYEHSALARRRKKFLQNN
jgi:hypothetical protein